MRMTMKVITIVRMGGLFRSQLGDRGAFGGGSISSDPTRLGSLY
jgi:hypothetical protein